MTSPVLSVSGIPGPKSGPVLGTDSGPEMGTVSGPFDTKCIRGGQKTYPFRGRNLYPKQGRFSDQEFRKSNSGSNQK